MMDNIREKLVELISHCACCYAPPCTGECFGCHNVEMYDKEIEHIADHLIANGVTVQEWIPVTERLPEECEDVLTFRKSAVRVEALESVSRNYWEDDSFSYYPVTHWMPLPTPPKGE